MSDILEEIKRKSEDASNVLSDAGFCTDSEIQSLTRQDLNELFPGARNIRVRREIFDIAHKQRANEPPRQEQFISEEALRAALTNNGVWNREQCLCILKDLKSEVDNVNNRLDILIRLLGQPGSSSAVSPSTSSGPVVSYQDNSASGASGSSCKGLGLRRHQKDEPFILLSLSEVFYQMVVAGQTFGAHSELMDKVTDSVKDMIKLVEGSQDPSVTFVFCPICSRIASDVEAAMTHVKDDKPVILVLMHHSHEVKYTTSVRTWCEDRRVVLHVNVFYHETVRGLLKCEENIGAVYKIRSELLKRFCPGSYNPSGNGLEVVTDGGTKRSRGGFPFGFGSSKK